MTAAREKRRKFALRKSKRTRAGIRGTADKFMRLGHGACVTAL
ncbi:hypothetical protein CAMRE0001_2559 [Campylobacter rectus RM3267]|uniref:Uncharacterized protein n=1 Tax=Campylobacter rectus RM3267 TaxID=553218 RepID=B9D3U5_CAMRE|nr:hypothetical protein CAMRE0001_2559 [Campylobacter rectus RM3267]